MFDKSIIINVVKRKSSYNFNGLTQMSEIAFSLFESLSTFVSSTDGTLLHGGLPV